MKIIHIGKYLLRYHLQEQIDRKQIAIRQAAKAAQQKKGKG